MGLKVNVIVLIVTIIVTLSTTAIMCLSILTNYWEVVTFSLAEIEKIVNETTSAEAANKDDALVSVADLHGGKVILVQQEKHSTEILIQIHAGLWTICYDVTGKISASVYITLDSTPAALMSQFLDD